MATKIVTKNSSTAGSAPSASDLVQGELAVNVVDKRLYTEDNAGNIVELGTNPSTIDINGGTIDGTVIGGTTTAAISGTTGQFGTSLNVDGTATMDGLTVGNAGSDYALKIKEGLGDEYYQLGVDSYGGLVFYNETTKVAEFTDASTFVTQGDITVNGTATMDGLTLADGGDRTITGPTNNDLIINSRGNTPGEGTRIQSSGSDRLVVDDTTGDISFYEDTGTTPKFFWDASAESLGIGTSSPTVPLTVNNQSDHSDLAIFHAGGGTPNRGLKISTFANTNTNAGVEFDAQNSTGAFKFSTGGTERMRIDSSGNVGIGTTSPSEKLHVVGGNIKTDSSTRQIGYWEADAVHDGYFVPYNASGQSELVNSFSTGGLIFKTGTSKAERMRIESDGNVRINDSLDNITGTLTLNGRNTGNIIFQSGGAEKMRLSGGNLLVGTTTSGIAGGTAQGINLLGQYGAIEASRSGNASLYLNRYTSDGKIAEFRKDGTAVGSVGTQSGRLTVGSNSASGVRFDGTQLVPMSGASISDNTITLGDAGFRFKDLYLSGGVYLGGTGAANKLDDYESGTWTPNLLSGTSITYTTTPTGSYTKIGKIVHISASIDVSNSNTADGSGLTIGGLPFSAVGDAMTFTLGRYRSFLAPKDSAVLGAVATSTYIQFFESNNNYILYSEIGSSGVLTFSGTYEAA